MFIRCEKQPCRVAGKLLKVGETLEVSEKTLSGLQHLIDCGWFSVHQNDPEAVRAARKASKSPKRARTNDGHYKADDPKTKDINEAWEGAAPQPKLKSLSKKQLTAFAKKLNIEFSATDTKAALLDKITKATKGKGE